MQPLITICIVHFRDTGFVLNTLYCLKHLTKNKYKVIIRDNNAGSPFYKWLEKGVKGYENVFLCQAEKSFNLRGSQAHGTALNDLAARIDTPYGVFLDADCTFLIKNWDEILISKLNDKVKMIGVPELGKEGDDDFPCVVAVLFDASVVSKLNIDFRPGPAKIQDTGWEMREKYQKLGLTGEILEMKNTRFYKEGPFKNVLAVAEYYLDQNYDRVFASHFGRGSTLGATKYKKGNFLRSFMFRAPIIGKVLSVLKGKMEQQRWIGVCRGIVERQL